MEDNPWNKYLFDEELPYNNLKYSNGEYYSVAYNTSSGFRSLIKFTQVLDEQVTHRMVAANKFALESWPIGFTWESTLEQTITGILIPTGSRGAVSPEVLYKPYRKIDLNLFKHKCPRCNNPALIMFTTVECSKKCGIK